LQHAFGETTSTHGGAFVYTGSSLDRVNLVKVYDNTIKDAVFTNCTLSGNEYGLYNSSNPCVLNKIRVSADGSNRKTIYFGASGGRTQCTDVIAQTRYSGSGYGMYISTSAADSHLFVSGCKAVASVRGVWGNINSIIENIFIQDCEAGVISASNACNLAVLNCVIERCSIAGFDGSRNSGLIIRGCEFNQNTLAIDFGHTSGSLVEDCDFNSNQYDITGNEYTADIYSVNNRHVTPGIRAYNRAGSQGAYYINNCTIDPASILKAFLTTATDNFVIPQYCIQNSFGMTGQYYGKFELVKNDLTVPPSLQLKFGVEAAMIHSDFKIASTYTKAGVGKVLRFKLTSLSSGWAGVLQPKIKLNGVTIQTESDITSISYGSDDTYEYTVLGSALTQDGELSVNFTAAANTISVLIKEFEVEDV
jgi:hypothetical protein